MQVEQWPLDKLKPFTRNPRLIPAEAVAKLAQAISELGFRNPIQVDKAGVIIAGHTRYLAAKKLGLKKVPVIVHGDMSEQEAAALRIADNRLAEETDWAQDLLADELGTLDGAFGPEVLGFNEKDMGKMFDLAAPEEEQAEADETAFLQPGQIWDLGSHQLTIGSAGIGHAYELLKTWKRKSKSQPTLEGRPMREVMEERS